MPHIATPKNVGPEAVASGNYDLHKMANDLDYIRHWLIMGGEYGKIPIGCRMSLSDGAEQLRAFADMRSAIAMGKYNGNQEEQQADKG